MPVSLGIRSWFSECLEALDALVFPMACELCGVDGTSSPFCADCRVALRRGLESMCPRCALPQGPHARYDAAGCSRCRGRSLGFDAVLAVGPYEDPLRAACLLLKRSSGAWIAPWLADLVIDLHGDRLRAIGANRVVPVPLHWLRRWRRGYNQAEAIARRLARRLHLPVRRSLRRVQATEKLADLGRRERAERMRRAFRARPDAALRGATVLLVDDILTTGATCGAAARVLKQAGAARVVAVVIGRTVGR